MNMRKIFILIFLFASLLFSIKKQDGGNMTPDQWVIHKHDMRTKGFMVMPVLELQIEFISNRRKVMAVANEKADAISDFPPAVNVSDFVDHIDYLVKKMGIEHVGISSDFDGGGGIEGWNNAAETFNVTLELLRHGYTEEQISMIWSGNLLRVLDEVEAIAKEIQSAE